MKNTPETKGQSGKDRKAPAAFRQLASLVASVTIGTVVACLGSVFLPAPFLDYSSASARQQVADEKATPLKSVDFTQIRRFQPSNTGLDISSLSRLLWERKRLQAPYVLKGPDGKFETPERQYWRQHPYPDIKFNRGAVFFSIDSGFPPGAVSVYGSRPIYNSQGFYTGKDQVLWQWNVPVAFRQARMTFPQRRGSFAEERFATVLLETAAARRLLLFDATKGMIWGRDVDNLIPKAPGAETTKDGEANPFIVAGMSCSFDCSSILVVLSPEKATVDVGTRLLVFDRAGKLISQTQIAGTQANSFTANGSGNSFLLSINVLFEDGKPFTGKPVDGDIFLRRDGTIAGLFTKADGSLNATRLDVSDDDAIAVTSTGLEYTMP